MRHAAGIPCDLVDYMSTNERIVCETRNMAPRLSNETDAVAVYRGHCQNKIETVTVVVNGVGGYISHAWNYGVCTWGNRWTNCNYRQSGKDTTQIKRVVPHSVRPGAEVSVYGKCVTPKGSLTLTC